MSPTPDRIRWHEEMLVTRQHLQLLSSRLESLIQSLPGRYHPFFWGVSRCEYVLTAGVLTVRALDAVMRNGFHVAIDDERAWLRLDLRPHAAGLRQQAMLVHLAMPLDDGTERNGSRRFVACEREAADVIRGDDGVEIPRLRTELVLVLGEAPAESRYTSFPLLEVRCQAASYIVTDFMPPTLQVTPASSLGQRCAAIPPRIRREISVVTDRGTDTLDVPFSVDVRAQLNPIVGALPAFEVLIAAAPHPFALYTELCRLAGAVAVLRNHVVPPQFPPYRHDDARTGFDRIVHFVLGLGADPASDGARRFTFERKGAWFRLPPEPGWTDALAVGSRSQMILAVQTNIGESQALKWAANCLITTRSAVQSMLSRRVLGLSRSLVAPGTMLPAQRDLHLFRLAPDPDAAKAGEALLVFADLPDVKPSALYLYIVEGKPEHRDG
jgi:type VI secretion system protein ImpJ